MAPGPVPMHPFDNSWQQAIDRWSIIMAARGFSPNTIDSRRRRINQLSRELCVTLADVTADGLLLWAARKIWRTRNARRNYYSCIRLFFKAIRPELAEVLPAVKRPPAVPRPVADTIFFSSIDRAEEREALILRLAREAGDRRGEIAALRGIDLILSSEGWVLYVHGKGDKERSIPISDELAAAIQHWINQLDDPTGWLFPGPHGHLSPGYVGHLARLALKPASEVATLHRLRHSYATTGVARSHNLIAMQHLLGHASVATTEQYVEVVDAALRQTAEAAAPSRTASSAVVAVASNETILEALAAMLIKLDQVIEQLNLVTAPKVVEVSEL